MSRERLQKVLASAGIGSRRKIEGLIREGLVTVNGKPAKLGDKADLTKDAVKVGGKLVQQTEPKVYYAFHKPKAVISALGDPEGRTSIQSYLGDIRHRIYPVGRLDFMSEGLILMTNDGELAEKIQKSGKLVRVYHVKVRGMLNEREVERLRRRGKVGEKWVNPSRVTLRDEYAKKSLVEIVFEGSGVIDVKGFFEARRFLVDRIVRVQFGHLQLGDLEPGKFRPLTESQLRAVVEQPELGIRRVEEQGEGVKPEPAAPKRKVIVAPTTIRAPKRPVVRGEGKTIFRPRTGAGATRPLRSGRSAERPFKSARGPRRDGAEGGYKPRKPSFSGRSASKPLRVRPKA